MARAQGGTICVVNSRNIEPRPANDEDPVNTETEENDDPDHPAATTSETASHKEKHKDPNREFELAHNFKSSVEHDALQFNRPAEWAWENRNKLPYNYKLDAVD